MVTEFTPFSALIGGLLIGLASAALLAFNGRIAGISGIIDGALVHRSGEAPWRFVFLIGLLIGAAGWFAVSGVDTSAMVLDRSTGLVIVAGLLVGFGTKMSNGCTSGHGVCGNARLSKRSAVATVVFMAAGAATVAAFGGVA